MFGLVIIIIVELALLFFAALVYLKSPKNKTNLIFSKFYFVITLWVIANYLENEFIDISVSSLFLRLDFFIAPFIFYYYLLFCLNFPEPTEITIQKKIKMLIPMIMLGLFSFSNLIIRDIKLTGQGIQFSESTLFIPYAVILFGYAVKGSLSLILKIRRYKGNQRLQIYYVLLGISIAAFIALTINLILTQLFVLPVVISRMGIYGLIVLAGFTAYAMIRHRLMDIRIVFTRAGVFTFVYALVLGIPFIAGWFVYNSNRSLWSLPLFLMAVLSSAGPFIYMKLQKRFESRIRAQEFKTQEALRRLSHNMLRFNNLKVLLKLIAHYLVKILRLNFAAIYLYESQYDKYLLSSVWQPKEEIGLPQEFEASGQLVRQLYIKKFPIVTEELGFYAPAPSAGRAKELFGVLSGLRINTVIPSFLRNGLVGFVVLSDRKNKIPFSQEDLNLLMVLSNEAALAIENAQFHQKEMFALLEKSKREALADMAPGASHQFNNRLAAISSSVELLLFKLENLDISNQPDEKIKFVLEDAKSALEMIDKEVYKGKEITSAILKRAKAKMEFQEFNLPGLIDNAYKLVMISRSRSDIEKAKEVKFSMDSLITNPSIVASEALLQDAFYNLIDNSYDAIQEKMRLINENKLGQEGSFDGIIEVTLRQDGSNVEVIIRDDGIGLTRENLRKLFTPYFTTKATSNKGSGLGLCVIRDFIERHKGSISCDSEYGKGAVFTIKLPMKR